MDSDLRVRTSAFDWLREQVSTHGEVLPWGLLHDEFTFEGTRVPLVSQQGIFKPKVCRLPISIRTSLKSPYDDGLIEDRLAYAYMGKNPNHWQNVGLRTAMHERVPLIYFYAVAEGRYVPVCPVLIVEDQPEALRFWVQAEANTNSHKGDPLLDALGGASIAGEGIARRYATRLVKQRLHQQAFSEQVLQAYQVRCCICRLRHRELLDAAHIRPDSEGGEAVVSNGLALCKIHHASLDSGVLGIEPRRLRVRIRADVLEEIDGPMLRHGLQELDGEKVQVPRAARHKPDPEALQWRWERFEQRAG